MAGFAHYKVITVDYRMPPDFPFPAALDDAVTADRELLKTTRPENIGIFGASAGGSLTLTTLLGAKAENLPMPGAIAPGSPTVHLSKTGDTLFTNAFVDNQLGTQDGFIRATALLYANGRDLKDPLLSPIYGDVHGFPPAILTSGTRDLYLSNTVRMHRKAPCAQPVSKPCCNCGKGNLTCSTWLNWPPFRPDTRHNLEGLRLSSSTGLCLTTTNVSN